MKLENFEAVARLIDTLDNCLGSIAEINKIRESDKYNPNGPAFYFSEYTDGSGFNTSLSRCNVSGRCIDAIVVVLEQKVEEVREELANLGVDMG